MEEEAPSSCSPPPDRLSITPRTPARPASAAAAEALPLLPVILSLAAQLADECRAVELPRSAETRRTCLRRRLSAAALPLRSLVSRLRRGLISADRGERGWEESSLVLFTAHAREALLGFRGDVLGIFRSLDNRARRDRAVRALLEHAERAVALIEERERERILQRPCSR